jgi:hypothetical protein
MKQQLPPEWDEERIRKVIEHYENQTDEEAVAEDEAAYSDPNSSIVIVPNELMPEIRKLLGEYQDRLDAERTKPSKRKAKPR